MSAEAGRNRGPTGAARGRLEASRVNQGAARTSRPAAAAVARFVVSYDASLD
jgi:hypothetical protein